MWIVHLYTRVMIAAVDYRDGVTAAIGELPRDDAAGESRADDQYFHHFHCDSRY